ncbi:hypothetical protein JC795_25860 [Pseudomonas veronii]|uniref:hypothetical protein n=1 Tax=Pseudomonas TaxID=286 RepID=UPI000B0E02CF|nr:MULTISPECIES: hypothetical protein [Pseudomonas]MBJ2181607.1 hypothetical protein [Pseudomonas veronii]VVO02973.1 hypothetical protein PS720_02796 [Pseudomonas fluorescens]
MAASDIYSIIALSLTMMAFIYGMFNATLKLKDSKYNDEKRRIEIEAMRRNLEEKIYHNTDRLTADPERWSQVNHLVMDFLSKSESDKSAATQDLSGRKFLAASGISLETLKIDKKKVFVLTPFHPRFEETYRLISGACQDVGLSCTRGDEQFIQGGILSHILREMTTAGIIIANIDGRNPNVFYELGIAHALGKGVIILASGLDDIPFDLRSQKLVLWKTPEELERGLHQALTRMLIES